MTPRNRVVLLYDPSAPAGGVAGGGVDVVEVGRGAGELQAAVAAAVRARQLLRRGATLKLAPGRHYLPRTLRITAPPADPHPGLVPAMSIESADVGNPAILDGGVVLDGFAPVPGRPWLFAARVPASMPAAAPIAQLFVAGERRLPARSPTLTYNATVAAPGSDPAHPTAAGIVVNDPGTTLAPLVAGHGRDLGMARVGLFHSWTTSFHQVAAVNETSGHVAFKTLVGTQFDGAECTRPDPTPTPECVFCWPATHAACRTLTQTRTWNRRLGEVGRGWARWATWWCTSRRGKQGAWFTAVSPCPRVAGPRVPLAAACRCVGKPWGYKQNRCVLPVRMRAGGQVVCGGGAQLRCPATAG